MNDVREVWDVVGKLCYHQHGGTGYSFTRADVLDMEWDEAMHHLERLGEYRKTEAYLIRQARSGK